MDEEERILSYQMSYTPGVTLGNVTVTTVPLSQQILQTGVTPFLLATVNNGLLFASGIAYQASLDASGQMIFAGVDASGQVSSTVLAGSLDYSHWISPSNAVVSASFVYASGVEKDIKFAVDRAMRNLPNSNVGNQLLMLAGQATQLRTPSSLSDTGFDNPTTIGSSIKTSLVSLIRSKLQEAGTQNSLFDIIVRNNGPVFVTGTTGTRYYDLNKDIADVYIQVVINNLSLIRTAYGRTNTLRLTSGIPVTLRVTYSVPIIDYDAGYMIDLANNAAINSWTNIGSSGSSANASGVNSPSISIDASGLRAVNVVKTSTSSFSIPSGLAISVDGATIIAVAKFNSTNTDEQLFSLGGIVIKRAGANNHLQIDIGTPYASALQSFAVTSGANTIDAAWHIICYRITRVNGTQATVELYLDSMTSARASWTPTITLNAIASTSAGSLGLGASASFRHVQCYGHSVSVPKLKETFYILKQRWNMS